MCDEVLPTCLQTGCKKLALKEDNVRVVLEADGTEVDEEDYFNFLPSDTTLLFLTNNDKWSHESSGKIASFIVFNKYLHGDTFMIFDKYLHGPQQIFIWSSAN